MDPIFGPFTALHNVCPEQALNILDTAHAVAHEYDGGCESLAPRMGVGAQVLRNKVNPNIATHHLTLAEAVRMSDLANDYRILETWAQQVGMALVKIPLPEDCADAEVVELMAKSLGSLGDVGAEIVKTLEDGRVERHEAEKVNDRAFAHITTVVSLTSRVAGMAEK